MMVHGRNCPVLIQVYPNKHKKDGKNGRKRDEAALQVTSGGVSGSQAVVPACAAGRPFFVFSAGRGVGNNSERVRFDFETDAQR